MLEFDEPETIARWLLRAADLYGETLKADEKTATAQDNTERFSPTELRAGRSRSLAPIAYDEQLDFSSHILREVEIEAEITARTEPDTAAQIHGAFDRGLARAFQIWTPENTIAALYLLSRLSERRRVSAGAEALAKSLKRGLLTKFSGPWKKTLGRRMAVLGHTFPAEEPGRFLLDALPARADFWTPNSSGFVCVGLVSRSPTAWVSILERHLNDLEQMNEVVRAHYYQSVVSTATLGQVAEDSCRMISDLWGSEATRKPSPRAPKHRVLKTLYRGKTRPITPQIAEPRQLKSRDETVFLSDITNREGVYSAFGGKDETLVICSERLEDLSGEDWAETVRKDPWSAMGDRNVSQVLDVGVEDMLADISGAYTAVDRERRGPPK